MVPAPTLKELQLASVFVVAASLSPGGSHRPFGPSQALACPMTPAALKNKLKFELRTILQGQTEVSVTKQDAGGRMDAGRGLFHDEDAEAEINQSAGWFAAEAVIECDVLGLVGAP